MLGFAGWPCECLLDMEFDHSFVLRTHLSDPTCLEGMAGPMSVLDELSSDIPCRLSPQLSSLTVASSVWFSWS